MVSAMVWNESELLEWIRRRARPPVLSGSRGHDAAVLRATCGRSVLCVDQVIEGVHVERGCARRWMGRKAAGRALSDLAATAARPRALLLSIAAPRSQRASDLRALIEGADEKARESGAALVGGDLSTTSGPLVLSVSALGTFNRRGKPPGRDRARPGEWVVLTGPVGGSRLGRHLDPRPRFAEAEFLVRAGARALMDVSDGLALDLSRLARAAGVRIELTEVPVHADAVRAARESGQSARAHALHDGEDHELIATLSPRAWLRITSRARRLFPCMRVIGTTGRGRGLHFAPQADGAALEPWDGKGGWVHGG
jgi:thiamine-monophosphate kinase